MFFFWSRARSQTGVAGWRVVYSARQAVSCDRVRDRRNGCAALVYLVFNLRGFHGAHGWGIPMAADASLFAAGALNFDRSAASQNRRKVLPTSPSPSSTTWGAVLDHRSFYSQAIVWSALGGAAVALLVLIGFNLIDSVRRLWPYLLVSSRPMVFCSCLRRALATIARRCATRIHHSWF